MAEQAMPERGSTLDEAKVIITGARQDQYGNPEDSFTCIAQLWSVWIGKEISAHDVAVMQSLLKIARIRTGSGSHDSYVDLCGYAALAADMASMQGEK